MAAGSISDYDATKIATLEEGIAKYAQVATGAVRISISPGASPTSIVIAALIATGPSNQTGVSTGQTLASLTDTVEKSTSFFNSLVTPTSTPSIIVEPGNTLITPGSPDPSGLAVLPGTNRLVPRAKVSEWHALKSIWKDTIHAGKDIPVHDVDPSTLPCLLTSEGAEGAKSDTVPLMRVSGLNCDGTPHTRNDGKPQKRWAVAHPSIVPTPEMKRPSTPAPKK